MKNSKGWLKKDSTKIFQSRNCTILQDNVIMPNGKPGQYTFFNTVNSVGVIAADRDGKIYLVGQHRYPLENKFSWETINGALRDIDPLIKAKEELREEAGLTAKKWNYLGIMYPIPGLTSHAHHVFLATDLESTETQREDSESDMVIAKKSLFEIAKMIKKQEIVCLQTIAAIYLYEHLDANE